MRLDPFVVTMLQIQEDAQRHADDWAAKKLAEAYKDDPVRYKCACYRCTTGDCCRATFLVTPLDVMPIAWHIHRSGGNTPEFRKECADSGARGLEVMLAGQIDDVVVPCVLLHEDNCSHYERRPLICRVYHVFGTNENCVPYSHRKDGKRPTIQMLDHGEISVFATFLNIQLLEVFGVDNASHKPWLHPLPTQLAVVLEALLRPGRQGVQHIVEHGSVDRRTFERLAECRNAQMKEFGLK